MLALGNTVMGINNGHQHVGVAKPFIFVCISIKKVSIVSICVAKAWLMVVPKV